MDKLLPCPICHEKAVVEYACGDYFAFCSNKCPAPMCDHPSEGTTICSWNDWATWYEKYRRAQPENDPLTLDELRAMDGEKVWVERVWGAKIKMWVITSPNGYGLTQDREADSQFMAWNTYDDLWLAYRHKPEGSEQ